MACGELIARFLPGFLTLKYDRMELCTARRLAWLFLATALSAGLDQAEQLGLAIVFLAALLLSTKKQTHSCTRPWLNVLPFDSPFVWHQDCSVRLNARIESQGLCS